jgi:pimeloyl-ACP methyl ester carboxylesterase
MKYYESDGARLAFDHSSYEDLSPETGEGVAVVFLHPTPLDHDYWRPVIERLNGVRAIVPDLRGHGASELGARLAVGGFAEAPDAPVLTMERLGADVVALLDSVGLESAYFVGCSIGGYVLMELVRRAPERMKGLAFVCSKAQPDAAVNRAKRKANIEQVRAEGTERLFDGMMQTLIGATARSARPEIVGELRARMTITAEAAVAVQAGLAVRPDSVPDIARIRVPVLAIAGGEDAGVTPAEMEAFKAAPGGCEFHVIADAGHFAAYEKPDEVAGILGEWLGRQKARSASHTSGNFTVRVEY